MAPITCSPTELNTAGAQIISVSTDMSAAIHSLSGILGGCAAMAGSDPAGTVFARSYDNSAQSLIEAIVESVNGTSRIGDAIVMGAANYAAADAASHPDGTVTPVLPSPTATPAVSVPAPPSAHGGTGGGPPGWSLLSAAVSMVWPNGNSAQLRAAAAAWKAFSAAAAVAPTGLATARPLLDQQLVPEQDHITTALTTTTQSWESLAQQASSLSGFLAAYATFIDQTHRQLLDVLSTLSSPTSLLGDIVELFTGDASGMTELAAQVTAVLHNFAEEVAAQATLLSPIVTVAETVISIMSSYTHMVLQPLEDLVYNDIARIVNGAASLLNTAAHNPDAVIAAAAGIGMITLGAGGNIGGLALDTTGVGAPAGLAVNAASTGLMIGGAASTAYGGLTIAADTAVGKYAINPMEMRHTSDPPGQTVMTMGALEAAPDTAKRLKHVALNSTNRKILVGG
ncbi:MAG: hypothetical protein ACRCSF_07010 [Mycobacteriaceae bacterium]